MCISFSMSLKDDYNWLCNFSKTLNKHYLISYEIVKWSFFLYPERDVTKLCLSTDKFNDLFTPNLWVWFTFLTVDLFLLTAKKLKTFYSLSNLKSIRCLLKRKSVVIDYWEIQKLVAFIVITTSSLQCQFLNIKVVIWLCSLLHEAVNNWNSKPIWVLLVLTAWFLLHSWTVDILNCWINDSFVLLRF